MAESILAAVPQPHRNIIRIGSLYRMNWQITFHFVSHDNNAVWESFKAMKRVLEDERYWHGGKKLYVVMEAPVWKQEANKFFRRAAAAWDACSKNADIAYTIDWASSSVWLTGIKAAAHDQRIGTLMKDTSSWRWDPQAVAAAGLTVAALDAALAEEA
jgi:hypothetical protein